MRERELSDKGFLSMQYLLNHQFYMATSSREIVLYTSEKVE